MDFDAADNKLDNMLISNDSPDLPFVNNASSLSLKKSQRSSVVDDLIDESGEEVLHYLEKFDVMRDPNIILLSSIRHYLYDSHELKRVKTIINLKPINQIVQITEFLRTMNRVLPMNGNFVGCFLDYNYYKKRLQSDTILGYVILSTYILTNRIIPRIPVFNKIQYLLSLRKIKSLTIKEAYKLLEINGFFVIDMTEINGMTFFISHKVCQVKKEEKSFFKVVSDFSNKLISF